MDKAIEQSPRRGRCHWAVAASDPSSCLRTARDGRQAPIRAGKGAGGNREAKVIQKEKSKAKQERSKYGKVLTVAE